MIVVDANLLLYAANRSAPEHDRARTWLDDRLNGSVAVRLSCPSLLAFVRLAALVTGAAMVWRTAAVVGRTMLAELERLDPGQVRVVELRFFGGLTVEETAEALAVSRATVKREWAVAKGWLHRALTSGP